MLILLLSSTASSEICNPESGECEPPEVCKFSTELNDGEISPCSGILVPPEKLKKALECRRVEVPTIEAERDKCLREIDIRARLYVAREDLLKSEIQSARDDNRMLDKILTISIGLISGMIIGMAL